MSTQQEFDRQVKNWVKRGGRTSYIMNHQSGFSDVMDNTQFDAGFYNSGTQEDTNDSSTGAPTDTIRTDDIGDSDWQGEVPGASDVGDGDITGALDVLQKHIESLGSSDLLNIWASTSDALKRTVSADMIKKAVPNVNGSTREPLHVGDNTAASNAGPQGYIDASQLAKKAEEILKLSGLSGLSSKVCNVARL